MNFIDIKKLTREEVKNIANSAKWEWSEEKSITAEWDRRKIETLVTEAYRQGFKKGIETGKQLQEFIVGIGNE